MVLVDMVTWIPSIYPSHVSIYTSTSRIRHGLYIYISPIPIIVGCIPPFLVKTPPFPQRLQPSPARTPRAGHDRSVETEGIGTQPQAGCKNVGLGKRHVGCNTTGVNIWKSYQIYHVGLWNDKHMYDNKLRVYCNSMIHQISYTNILCM